MTTEDFALLSYAKKLTEAVTDEEWDKAKADLVLFILHNGEPLKYV